MAKLKVILSDPQTGQCQTVEVEGPRAAPLVGRKIGETIDGSAVGLGGHKLRITGGSDKDGFPMRPDIHGGVKAKVIITKGVGFRSTTKGERKRKTVRGKVVTEDIVQLNMKIVEKPKKKERAKSPEKAIQTEDKSDIQEEGKEERQQKQEKQKQEKQKQEKQKQEKQKQEKQKQEKQK
ncbi:MAG: 30S ribosomal protein S6e, partial [Candidatus Bathyarchaeota archaeon]